MKKFDITLILSNKPVVEKEVFWKKRE